MAKAGGRFLGREDGVLQRFGSQRRASSDEMRRQPRRDADLGQVAVYPA